MKKFVKYTIRVLIALLLLTYAGVQGYRIFFKSIKTEVAVSYVMSNNISCQGVIIRDEEVIDAKNDGFYYYLVENGSKVSRGQRVAAVYSSENVLTNTQKLEQLKLQKSILQQVSQQTMADTTPEEVSQDIVDLLTDYNTQFAQNDFSDASVFKTSLLAQISRRQLAVGGSVDFSAQIAAVQAEIDALGNVGSSKAYEKAPYSGYFSSGSDGLESVLTADTLDELTLKQVEDILSSTVQNTGSFGRIVKSFNWYVAAVVSEDAIGWIEDTNTVYLQFVGTHNESIKGTVYRIGEVQNGKALLIVKCNDMTASLVNMRLQNVIISSAVKRGVRFPSSALHIENGEKGVYIKSGNVLTFKKVDILAQDDHFILSEIKEDETAADYLNVFDEIVVSGEDLYDGKRIT